VNDEPKSLFANLGNAGNIQCPLSQKASIEGIILIKGLIWA
jgi:hypothetical protein